MLTAMQIQTRSFKVMLVCFFVVCIVGACDDNEKSGSKKRAIAQNTQTETKKVSESYELNLAVKVLSDYKVEFQIHTNLPTPVDIMALIDLADQQPDETFIGYSEKVRLNGPDTTIVIDTKKSERALPTGDYIAEVRFYPLWGAKNGNPEAANAPEIASTHEISLKGSGESVAAVKLRNARRNWVMENIYMNVPWNEADIVRRLGPYEKSRSTLSNLHDAYYFTEIDMTMIVNRLKNEITIWRTGRASQ